MIILILVKNGTFLENHVADFATKMHDFATKVRMLIMAGLL